MRTRLLSRTAILAAGLLVSACVDPGAIDRQSLDATLRTEANVEQNLHKLTQPAEPQAPGTIRIADGIWLGGRSVRSENGDPLPASLEKKDGVTLISPRPLTLAELSAEVSGMTGLPVRVDLTSEEQKEDAGTEDDDENVVLGNTSIEQQTAGEAAAANTGERVTVTRTIDEAHSIEWTGPLSGLMDFIGAKFNVSWEYRDGGIRMYRYVTASLPLYAMPGTTDFTAGVGGDVGGGGSSSSSSGGTLNATQRANVTAAVKIWDEIKDTVEKMLPEGGKASFAQATGVVTVVAPPNDVRRISDYIAETNKRLLRQVAFNVQVLEFTLNDTEDYTFDISAIINDLQGLDSKRLTLGGATTGGLLSGATGAGNVQFDILSGSDFDGSSAVLRALSARGRVSVVTSAAATTLNNQPVPIQVVEDENYVRRTTVTQQGDSSPTTSTELETDTVTTGFGVTLLPRILDDGRLLLQFSLNLSTLLDLDDFSSEDGNSKVQLPKIDRRTFLQQVMLRSGDTLVLAGFEKATDRNTRRGVGSPDFWLFGGGRGGEHERNMLVILLTPTVLKTPEANRPDEAKLAAR